MGKDSFLGKLINGYDKLEERLLCASLVLTTLIIFAQIIMRSVFNSSLTWSEELARYIYIYQIWLGVSVAQKYNAHIRVELLFSFVKNKKAQTVIDIIATIILLLFNLFLIKAGTEVAIQMYVRGNVSGALRLPLYLIYIVLPISSALLSLRLVGHIADDVKSLGAAEQGGLE